MHDPMVGASFVSQDGVDNAWLWGSSWLCKVRLNQSTVPMSKKRSRGNLTEKSPSAPSTKNGVTDDFDQKESSDDGNFKVVTHFRPILFTGFIGPKELVIVERPLVDVMSRLPPAFFKPKYGKT